MDPTPSTLTSDTAVLAIFEEEYCKPTGITLELLLVCLRTPPLTTVVRYNHLPDRETGKICTEIEQKNLIMDQLRLVNEERLKGRTLAVKSVPGLQNIWICEILGAGSKLRSEDAIGEDMKVIVDLAAGESLLRGSHLYAPGILACPGHMRKGQRVAVFCDVQKKCLKGRTADYDGELYFVGGGVALWPRGDLFTPTAPTGLGILIDEPAYDLLSLNEFLSTNPAFTSNNLPSCVAVQVLNPQPHDTILDCCAAPGGKTVHMASMMRGTGRIVALDKSVERAEKLTAMTAQYRNVEVFCADVCRIRQNGVVSDWPPRGFDRILVDAPCSASGQRPRLSLRSLHKSQLDACPKVQRRILHTVVPLLKSGGFLVYSTCSVLTRENEDVVAWILQEHRELKLCRQTPHLGHGGFPHPALSGAQSALLQRFPLLPEAELDSIGFFIALFQKD